MFDDVRTIEALIDRQRELNDAPTYQLHLVHAGVPGATEGTAVVLSKWLDRADAEQAADWLRREIGVAGLSEQRTS